MIVGLTGGIASGKTFCTDYLNNKYSICIIDADVLAREVVVPGSEALREIQRVFGNAVIQHDGSLDRAQMRTLILQDDAQRMQLNAIVHPRVRELMLQRLRDTSPNPYQVLSVPLLFENNLHRYVDIALVVDVDEPTQLLRVQQRDQCDEQSAAQMITAQMSRADRLRQSHFVINNSVDKESTYMQLDTLHSLLCSYACP